MSLQVIDLGDAVSLTVKNGKATLVRAVGDHEPSQAKIVGIIAEARKRAGLSIALDRYWTKSGLAWECKVIQSLLAKKDPK